MHQTFYIDIDEEITSVVERLRHARASEIILVVPKRALLIQSIVNLRILKREADEARLQLMMVTQDKLGKILIEKAGIFVQQKMDNIADEEIEVKEESRPAEDYMEERVKNKNGKSRLDQIGSGSYFDASLFAENTKAEQIKLRIEKPASDEKESAKEVLINKELVLTDRKEVGKKVLLRPSFDLMPVVASSKEQPTETKKTVFPDFTNEKPEPNFQDKKIENFFYQPNALTGQTKKKSDESKSSAAYNLPGKVHRWFWTIGIAIFFLLVMVGVYLFVPKATVVVSVKMDEQTIDSQVIGRIDAPVVDFGAGIIPAKAVSSTQEVSASYDATGSKLVSNQRAHGTVTIYNEYSSSPQPLVATTRFLTSDGKLFRLASGVTVPGTSMVNGQAKNGEVEAEITADSSGDDYNIGPATFNIPGFKSSGIKYNKIYAKSVVAMTGGGNGSSESKVIADSDIASAKSKILTALNNKLEEDMKKNGTDDAVILDGALNEGDVAYKLSNSAGDVANSFQITASAEAKAILVSQKDLNAAILELLKKTSGAKNIDSSSLKTDFSRADSDFVSGTVNIKFHAVGKINPDFTADFIKKAILGKDEDQIKTYLSGLSNIEKVEVEYWPPFLSGRIPFLGSQVKVAIDGI